jgi:predicted transcriptional regulator
MRTTFRLDDQLLAELKQLAAQTGRTLTAVMEDALREMLARRRETSNTGRVRLITAGAGGLRPGVNLDNSAELLDLMEQDDAVD